MKPEARNYIGIAGEFMAGWVIDDGEYQGQLAMIADTYWPFGWCPQEDLEILEA